MIPAGRVFNSATASLWKTYAALQRPEERLSPSMWAARHRHLSENEAERAGLWSNEYFPYLAPVMDSAAEALETGRRGWCMMKSAQGGGSQAVINVMGWLTDEYPGPVLYLHSKDELAEEFGRTRLTHMIDTAEPLKRIALRGRKGGEGITKKRFAGGRSWKICGGRSVLNLQSLPYRFVIIDEVDSLMDEIKNEGDPIALAEKRTSSFVGKTLLMAFAHPSTKERGAAKLYYQLSDQRRGYVRCPHCAGEFYLQWEHVKAVPQEGMNKQQAERDAACHAYYCPSCACEISDAQRILMVRQVVYKSSLPPEIAAKRPWIGVHFSQLYMPNQTIRRLAEEWVKSIDSEGSKRAFYNKVLGEPYEAVIDALEGDDWRRLMAVPRHEKDPETFARGEAPRWARFLTAGQDSRGKELHFAVWAWGLRRTVSSHTVLCCAPVQWGKIERPYSEQFTEADFHALDGPLWQTWYPRAHHASDALDVRQCGFDTSWAPTQIPVHQYCRSWPHRAIPIKGGANTSVSTSPFMKPGAPLEYKLGEAKVRDEGLRILNTYVLKTDFYGMARNWLELPGAAGRPSLRVSQIVLPQYDGSLEYEEFIAHLSSETLESTGRRGRHADEKTWKRHGENHWLDCSIYAFACALNLDPYQEQLTFDEAQAIEDAAAQRPSGAPPAGPGWIKDRRDGRDWITSRD